MLSCMWDGAYKINLCCYSERVAHVVTAEGFFSQYLNGPLPFARHHKPDNVLSVLLSKTFAYFLPESGCTNMVISLVILWL